MPNVIVNLSQVRFDALDILPGGRQKWADDALNNKANNLIDVLVTNNSDKQPNKITEAEKEVIVNGIDLEKEKDKRKKG